MLETETRGRPRTLSLNEHNGPAYDPPLTRDVREAREPRSRSTQRPLTANDTFNNFIYEDIYRSPYQDLASQSHTMLQQSKAKHQAMVAQAHAARSIADDDGYVPKPPPKPSSDRKPSSAHRLARSVF